MDYRQREQVDGEAGAGPLPWIRVAPDSPYFIDEAGAPFTPIGQNDAISWPELNGLFRRRDLAAVERHLAWLKEHGVTVLRIMLEYAQVRSRYFERPAGRFNPAVVQVWDDLFAMCERVGLRLLLTPFDTFWTWLHWRHHPYNEANGGPLEHPRRLLLCPATRELIRNRLLFATRRWGGSGALFAWDLWNEIHPAQAEDGCEAFEPFISDLADAVRREEVRLYGRSHPQTVSLFGPELTLKPHMDMASPIFRHASLDFASIHIYKTRAIDNPRNTIEAAMATGEIVRESIAEIHDGRPFLDSEHGPIHTFKDRKKTLPQDFDDEYFLHMQWAHLASGGAGGGMRWPNRHPHVLTAGMRRAQAALSRFLPLIDWRRFRRRNLNNEVVTTNQGLATFACGDSEQAVVWLLRRGPLKADGTLVKDGAALRAIVRVPGLGDGKACITPFDTGSGFALEPFYCEVRRGALVFEPPPIETNLAVAISLVGVADPSPKSK